MVDRAKDQLDDLASGADDQLHLRASPSPSVVCEYHIYRLEQLFELGKHSGIILEAEIAIPPTRDIRWKIPSSILEGMCTIG